MATNNEPMVKLCQHLTETNQEQVNQIAKLISRIKIIAKLLSLNRTRAPLQEEDKKEKSAVKKRCKLCGKFHKNPDYFR